MPDGHEGPPRSLLGRARRTWTLLQTLTPREFRVRYRESYLDLAWAIVTPLVLLAVYGLILSEGGGNARSEAANLTCKNLKRTGRGYRNQANYHDRQNRDRYHAEYHQGGDRGRKH